MSGPIHQVPLVIYKSGVRHVVGKADLKENGELVAQVYKDRVVEIKSTFLAIPLEVVITPKVQES